MDAVAVVTSDGLSEKETCLEEARDVEALEESFGVEMVVTGVTCVRDDLRDESREVSSLDALEVIFGVSIGV